MARRHRPSGFQHRKKAKARESTSRVVRGLMALANRGPWPAEPPLQWVTHEESRGLASLQAYVAECLEQFRLSRRRSRLDADVREVATMAHFPTREDEPETWLEVARAISFCHQVLGHLQENERWRNVYRCATCQNWFYAWHDPKNPGKPYCSKKCWPSRKYVKSERPRTRVTSKQR
jgi:hypothetical protein